MSTLPCRPAPPHACSSPGGVSRYPATAGSRPWGSVWRANDRDGTQTASAEGVRISQAARYNQPFVRKFVERGQRKVVFVSSIVGFSTFPF